MRTHEGGVSQLFSRRLLQSLLMKAWQKQEIEEVKQLKTEKLVQCRTSPRTTTFMHSKSQGPVFPYCVTAVCYPPGEQYTGPTYLVSMVIPLSQCGATADARWSGLPHGIPGRGDWNSSVSTFRLPWSGVPFFWAVQLDARTCLSVNLMLPSAVVTGCVR